MKRLSFFLLAALALSAAGCSKHLATSPDVEGSSIHALRPSTGAANPNPGVAPHDSKPFGLTYGEWQARWWQWAYATPVSNHPLFDEVGTNAAVGQTGQVWFLGGVFNVSGSASRVIDVPSGKSLFFPILNFEADNFFPPIVPPLDVAGLRALAAGLMDGATDLACELDGVAITELASYRGTSPVFGVTLPDDNIPQAFGIPAAPGDYAPLVDDGYYLFLNPLSVGTHHLHFHGSVPGFTLDINYEIHVLPGNGGGGRSRQS